MSHQLGGNELQVMMTWRWLISSLGPEMDMAKSKISIPEEVGHDVRATKS